MINNEQFLTLTQQVLEHLPKDGLTKTIIEGLSLYRCSVLEEHDTCIYEASMTLVLQGEKESFIGNQCFQYGPKDFIVNGVDIPAHSHVTKASVEQPLITLSVNIDKALIQQLAAQMSTPLEPLISTPPSVSVNPVEVEVLDVLSRLIKLLDKPEQAALMAPLLIRELTARMLMTSQGQMLRHLYQQGSHSQQINQAISWIKQYFSQHFQVKELADKANMATSTFHRQFKAITSLSPLQYQKRLRLFEAQRLMLSERIDANTASIRVGYESPQQFNREYKRLFGVPPLRNIKQLRHEG